MPCTADVWEMRGTQAQPCGYQLLGDEALEAHMPDVAVSCWVRCEAGGAAEGAGAQCLIHMWSHAGAGASLVVGGDAACPRSRLVAAMWDSDGTVAEASGSCTIRDGRWHFVSWRMADASRGFVLQVDSAPLVLLHSARSARLRTCRHPQPQGGQPGMHVNFGFSGRPPHEAAVAAALPFQGSICEIRILAKVVPADDEEAPPAVRVLRQYSVVGEPPFANIARAGADGEEEASADVAGGRCVDPDSLVVVGQAHRLVHSELPIAHLFVDGHSSCINMGEHFCEVGKSLGQCVWSFHLSTASRRQHVLCDIQGQGRQRFHIVANSDSTGTLDLNRIWVRLCDVDGQTLDVSGVFELTTGRWHTLAIAIDVEDTACPITMRVDGCRLLTDCAAVVAATQPCPLPAAFSAFETTSIGCPLPGCPVQQAYRGLIRGLAVEGVRVVRVTFDQRRGRESTDLISGRRVRLHCPCWLPDRNGGAVLQIPRQGSVLFEGAPYGEALGEDFAAKMWVSSLNKQPQTLLSACTGAGDAVFGIELNAAEGEATLAASTLWLVDANGRRTEAVFATEGLCDGAWHHLSFRIICARQGVTEVQIDGANTQVRRIVAEGSEGFHPWARMCLGGLLHQGVLASPFVGAVRELAISHKAEVVGHWPMCEGMGLTLENSVGAVKGKPMLCAWGAPASRLPPSHLFFDGRRSHVLLSPVPQLWASLEAGQGGIIELCMKTTDAGTPAALFSLSDSRSSQCLVVALNRDSHGNTAPGTLAVLIRDAYGGSLMAHSAQPSVFDGQFHHMTWRIPSGPAGLNVQLIIDGGMVPFSSTFVFGSLLKGLCATDSPLVLGAQCRPSQEGGVTECFEGHISNVRVWGGGDEELVLDLPLSDGLGAAETVVDLSRNRNVGHLRGTSWRATEGLTAIPVFQGEESCINLGTIGETGRFMDCLTIDMYLQITRGGHAAAAARNCKVLPPGTSCIIGGFDCNGLGFAVCFDLENEKAILVVSDLDGKRLVAEAGGELLDSVWHRLTVEVLSSQKGQVKVYVDGHSKPVTVLVSEGPVRFSKLQTDVFLGGVNTPAGLCNPFHGFIQDLRILTHTCSVQGNWPLRNSPCDVSGNCSHAQNVNTTYTLVDWDGADPSSILYFGRDYLATMKQQEVSKAAVCECSSWDPKHPGFRPGYVLRSFKDAAVGWKAQENAPQWLEVDFSSEGGVCLTGVNLVLSSDLPGILKFEVLAGQQMEMSLLCRRMVYIENKAAVHCRCDALLEGVTRVRLVVLTSPSYPACHRIKCLGYHSDESRLGTNPSAAAEGQPAAAAGGGGGGSGTRSGPARTPSKRRAADITTQLQLRMLFRTLDLDPETDTVTYLSAKTALEGLDPLAAVTATPAAVASKDGRVCYDAFCMSALRLLAR